MGILAPMQDGLAWVKGGARYTIGLVVVDGVVTEAPPRVRRWIGRRYLALKVELLAQGHDIREVIDEPLPPWWPSWLPAYCSNHHALRPGTVGMHWYPCECPGAEYHGHHRARCRRCDWTLDPPEHTTLD